MRRMGARRAAIAGLPLCFALACAAGGWERTRAEDTTAAYERFLEKSPRSSHAAEARERIDYLNAKRNPTSEAVDRFRSEHRDSGALLSELEALLESRSFDAARTEGSVQGYLRFLERFPDRAFAARAAGNLAYLRAKGFPGNSAELAKFAERHPESDYRPEALRTLGLLEGGQQRRFQAISLVIEILPALPDGERVRKEFLDRATVALADAGVLVVNPADGSAGGRLTIRHVEKSVPTELYEGRMTGPGILAETTVTLEVAGQADPVWSQAFTMRVPALEHRAKESILFSPRSSRYWADFFVPVATWQTQLARRGAMQLREGAVAVAADTDRAWVLFADGSFQEIDLSDPIEPRQVGEYARRADLSRFSGLRILDHQVVLFGEDGLEVVSRGPGPRRRLHAWSRADVGAIAALDVADGILWVASSRGLLRAPLAGGPVEVIAPRPLRGVAVARGTLYVLDDRRVYAAPLAEARGERFQPVVDLGVSFDPARLSVRDGYAVVVGRRGIAVATALGSGRLPISRLELASVGRVSDVAIAGARAFALGDRGLLVVDLRAARVIDSVDVEPRTRVSTGGRHVLTLDGRSLQVVDATPWVDEAVPAALDTR